jgi:hypothetical protein
MKLVIEGSFGEMADCGGVVVDETVGELRNVGGLLLGDSGGRMILYSARADGSVERRFCADCILGRFEGTTILRTYVCGGGQRLAGSEEGHLIVFCGGGEQWMVVIWPNETGVYHLGCEVLVDDGNNSGGFLSADWKGVHHFSGRFVFEENGEWFERRFETKLDGDSMYCDETRGSIAGPGDEVIDGIGRVCGSMATVVSDSGLGADDRIVGVLGGDVVVDRLGTISILRGGSKYEDLGEAGEVVVNTDHYGWGSVILLQRSSSWSGVVIIVRPDSSERYELEDLTSLSMEGYLRLYNGERVIQTGGVWLPTLLMVFGDKMVAISSGADVVRTLGFWADNGDMKEVRGEKLWQTIDIRRVVVCGGRQFMTHYSGFVREGIRCAMILFRGTLPRELWYLVGYFMGVSGGVCLLGSYGYVVVTDAKIAPTMMSLGRDAKETIALCESKEGVLKRELEKMQTALAKVEAKYMMVVAERKEAEMVVAKGRSVFEAGTRIAGNRWAYVGMGVCLGVCGNAVVNDAGVRVGYTCVGLGVCSTRCACV